MSQDDEISALERAIREGDESKWDALDAALLRAGRLPRRVFYVRSYGGEYDDAWDTNYGPSFVQRSQAEALMHRLAVQRDWEEWKKNEEDGEGYVGRREGKMFVDWMEVVPPGGESLRKCPYSCPSLAPNEGRQFETCFRRDGHP